MQAKLKAYALLLVLAFVPCPQAAWGGTAGAYALEPLGVQELVRLAIRVNPAVKTARSKWYSALHRIKQNYAPADPQFNFINGDSYSNGFTQPAYRTYGISDSFQFPGKASLHGDIATHTAEIARLSYYASMRDVRAETEAAYYQALLDRALAEINADNIASLRKVLKVTQVAYAANQVTQSDFISAEFDLAQAEQRQRRFLTNEMNDLTALNQLLDRPPDSPLRLSPRLELRPLKARVDELVARATSARQEILQAALSVHNSKTALRLARMEYLPDYTLSYFFDDYYYGSAAPAPGRLQDHGEAVSVTLPLFFWMKQNEDIESAHHDLAAARDNFESVRIQTQAAVTQAYRTTQLAYETALVYRDSLIRLARQNFEVALVGYQSAKIDFVTLSAALANAYGARIAYLRAANEYLAGRVALERAIGEPLAQ